MGLFDLFRKDKKDDVTRELEEVKKRRNQSGTEDTYGDLAGTAGVLVVDDVFSITGRGTVVTGMVTSGMFTVGDNVEVTGIDGSKVRSVVTGLEAFRKLMKTARQGDRVGMLLKDLSRQEIGPGDEVHKI